MDDDMSSSLTLLPTKLFLLKYVPHSNSEIIENYLCAILFHCQRINFFFSFSISAEYREEDICANRTANFVHWNSYVMSLKEGNHVAVFWAYYRTSSLVHNCMISSHIYRTCSKFTTNYFVCLKMTLAALDCCPTTESLWRLLSPH
jgi:hypothetical protein